MGTATFGLRLPSCLTFSRSTLLTKASPVKPEDSPVPLLTAVLYSVSQVMTIVSVALGKTRRYKKISVKIMWKIIMLQHFESTVTKLNRTINFQFIKWMNFSCVHTHMRAHARARAHTHTRTHTRTHARLHARTRAHTHTHTYTHTHTEFILCKCTFSRRRTGLWI